MSNAHAVATVTAALQHLLAAGLRQFAVSGDVTARPPDKARRGDGNQLNVFLYHTSIDPALRNQDPPGLLPGESGFPALPLVLHYVISAYGLDDDDIEAHRLLGRAMSVLHDHPVLGPDEFTALVPGADLDLQGERVRVTPQPLGVDEMYRLWMAFQTQYRISAAYEVSVVLIDSARAARTPLPVLARGEGDTGVVAQSDLVPPFPAVSAYRLPEGRTAARPGDALTLLGHHLEEATTVRLRHRSADPVQVVVDEATAGSVRVTLPAALAAGVWAVEVGFGNGRAGNEVPLPVAPEISGGLPVTLVRDSAGAVRVALTCLVPPMPGQEVFLLLGDRQIAPDAAGPGLSFTVAGAGAGTYLVRLRVDGVDSRLVDHSVAPPVFDGSQKVTIK
ncbi:DUF4255 domain-containing protein [Streptomyces chartreusis]